MTTKWTRGVVQIVNYCSSCGRHIRAGWWIYYAGDERLCSKCWQQTPEGATAHLAGGAS